MAIASSPVRHQFQIALAGAGGSLMGIFADLRQKEHASAILKLSNTAATALHLALPPLATIAFVILAGVFICFILEARSARHAFFTGLGVLSTVMVLVPYEVPPSLPTRTSQLGAFRAAVEPRSPFLAPAVVFAQSQRVGQAKDPVEVKLTLQIPDKNATPQATVTLRNLDGKVLAQSVFTGTEFVFLQPPGEYVIGVEVSGYSISACVATLQNGKAKWIDVSLHPSSIPLAAQRLLQTGARPPACQEHKP